MIRTFNSSLLIINNSVKRWEGLGENAPIGSVNNIHESIQQIERNLGILNRSKRFIIIYLNNLELLKLGGALDEDNNSVAI
jgi:hypothetical protein